MPKQESAVALLTFGKGIVGASCENRSPNAATYRNKARQRPPSARIRRTRNSSLAGPSAKLSRGNHYVATAIGALMSAESLTCADLAGRLRTSREATRSRVRRLELPRQTGNDGTPRANVDPAKIQHKPPYGREEGSRHPASFDALSGAHGPGNS
jgi:hypothetical protein